MAIPMWWRGNPQAQPAAAKNPQARPQQYQPPMANRAMNRGRAAGGVKQGWWNDGIPNNNPNNPKLPYWKDGIPNNNPNGRNNQFPRPGQISWGGAGGQQGPPRAPAGTPPIPSYRPPEPNYAPPPGWQPGTPLPVGWAQIGEGENAKYVQGWNQMTPEQRSYITSMNSPYLNDAHKQRLQNPWGQAPSPTPGVVSSGPVQHDPGYWTPERMAGAQPRDFPQMNDPRWPGNNLPYWADGIPNNNPNGPRNQPPFQRPAQVGWGGGAPRLPGNGPPGGWNPPPQPPQGGGGGYGYESGGNRPVDRGPTTWPGQGWGPPPHSQAGGRDFREAPQGRGARQAGRNGQRQGRAKGRRPVRRPGQQGRQQGAGRYQLPGEGATEADLRRDALGAGVPDFQTFNLEADENWIEARRQLDSQLYEALAANNFSQQEIDRQMKLFKERMDYRHGLDLQDIDQSMEDRGLFNSGIRTGERQRRNVDYSEQWQDAQAEAHRGKLDIERSNAQVWRDYIRAQQEGLLDLSDMYYDNPPSWVGRGNNGYPNRYDDELPGGQRSPKKKKQPSRRRGAKKPAAKKKTTSKRRRR